MIYIPLKYLKPGLVVAREISYYSHFVPLIATGQKLSVTAINKLSKYGIQGAYIENCLCEDIEVDDLIGSAFKKEMVTEIKYLFNEYTSQKSISITSIKSISKLAENLIVNILSKSECFMNVIDIKEYDSYTYTHSMYVGLLSVLIGINLGFSRATLVELAMCGLLHDIGKMDIPLEIINKTSALTSEEFDIMKTHPQNAVLRLRPCCQISSVVLSGIETHHEKINGTGYPYGLKGNKIPIFGRIIALADVYDALTSQRSYRRAWTSGEAVEYMMGCADTHFDFELLQAFLKTVAAYPVGTVVKLSNGLLAVVIQNFPESILRPKVRLIQSKGEVGEEINLSTNISYLNITIIGIMDEEISFL